jgi:hypothetical protein
MAAGSTYTPIASTVLTTTANSITFSSIANTYTDLRLVLMHSGTYTSITYGSHYLQFNSDTATNYSYTALRGSGTSASSDRGSTLSEPMIGYNIVNTVDGSLYSVTTIDILSYAGNTNKSFISRHFSDTGTSAGTIATTVGLWRSTSAINTIKVYPGDAPYRVGTTATLYGITAA